MLNLVANLGGFDGTRQQLAQLVFDQVTTFPETHHQAEWFNDDCGTVACVSGWAQLFCDGYVQGRLSDSRASHRRGQELLGLSDYDATRLFYMVNNDQAKLALKYLANGETIDWAVVGHKFRSDDALKEQMDMHRRIYWNEPVWGAE